MKIIKYSSIIAGLSVAFSAQAFEDKFIAGNDVQSVSLYGYKVGDSVEAIISKLKDPSSNTQYSINSQYDVALATSVADSCIARYELWHGDDRDSVMQDILREYIKTDLTPNPLVEGLLVAYSVKNPELEKRGELLTLWIDDEGKIQAMLSEGHRYPDVDVDTLRNVVLNRFGSRPDDEWRLKNGSRIIAYTDSYRPIHSAGVYDYFYAGDYLLGKVTKQKTYNYKAQQDDFVATFYAMKGTRIHESSYESDETSLSVFIMNDPSTIQDKYIEKYDSCFKKFGQIEKQRTELSKQKAESISL